MLPNTVDTEIAALCGEPKVSKFFRDGEKWAACFNVLATLLGTKLPAKPPAAPKPAAHATLSFRPVI